MKSKMTINLQSKRITEIKQDQLQVGSKQLRKWVMTKMSQKESTLPIRNFKSITFMVTEVTIPDPTSNIT